jgi:2-dehydropantoate 2-reductase
MTAVGDRLALSLLAECSAIAGRNGFAPRNEADERARKFLTTPGSPLQASMAKDIERGARIEADHIVGDLLARKSGADANGNDWSLLRVAYAGLKAYEARREREIAASA